MTRNETAMSEQEQLKQAHEFGCLRAAQESLAGFPQGQITPGDNPPDCYVVLPESGMRIAFELTEQVDEIAVRAAALAGRRFIDEVKRVFFQTHPEHRTGWMVSASPGDIFETTAAKPDYECAWRAHKNKLIERFVSVVAAEIANRHSFRWRVSGEPIWRLDVSKKSHHQELTGVSFRGAYRYSLKGNDRIVNHFGRDVTFKPEMIQARITKKISGLERHRCRPSYLLVSASLFPRPVRSAGSFAVLKTPQSIVDHSFDIGGFTAVFLHDPYGRNYRVSQNGQAVEMEERQIRSEMAVADVG